MLDLSNSTRFGNLPRHRSLLERIVPKLLENKRIKGLYLSGSPKTDENSDIDLIILSSEEDREDLEKEVEDLAKKVGKIKVEAWAGVPHTYVVFYDAEEVKVDFSFHIFPEKRRPDRATIEILYDPTGDLQKLVEDSAALEWEIDLAYLEGRIKHFFAGIAYTVAKIDRGELWDGKDCVDFYGKYLIKFEDILAQRKQESYRRLEQKLSEDKLQLFNQIVVKEISRKEILRALDAVFSYFDKYLKEKLNDLGIYPEDYAEKMLEYYKKKKSEILKKYNSS
ncbi:MAG: nucleotidyltransferase domain-containing protein [Candidatus Heimdallarchaeaceae archaeon]